MSLIRTIYLGDRGCTAILIDSANARVAVAVDCISRIRSPEGRWNYYTKEDIPAGRLVFGGVESLSFTLSGLIPNDFINDLRICGVNEGDGAVLADMSFAEY